MRSWEAQRIHERGTENLGISEVLFGSGTSRQELSSRRADQGSFANPPAFLIAQVTEARHQSGTAFDRHLLCADTVSFLARPSIGVRQIAHTDVVGIGHAPVRSIYVCRPGIQEDGIAVLKHLEN